MVNRQSICNASITRVQKRHYPSEPRKLNLKRLNQEWKKTSGLLRDWPPSSRHSKANVMPGLVNAGAEALLRVCIEMPSEKEPI